MSQININELDDKAYLLAFCEVMMNYKTADACVILNKELEFIAISNNIAKLINEPYILGKKVRDLNSPLGNYAEDYAKATNMLEKITLTKPVPIEYLIIFNNNKYLTLWQHIASKIINPATGNHLGILVNVNQINPSQLLVHTLTGANKHMVFLGKYDNLFKTDLTQKDCELLFLLALGKTHKEIAEILSQIHKTEIIPQTVTTWINRHLYTKFEVNSTSQLIDNAYKYGILDVMPISFNVLLENEIIIN